MTPPADPARYKNHRFPGEIISHGVWLYYRFPLSYRDVQERLCERGSDVTHDAIRQWCLTFGQDDAHQLKRRHAQPGDRWHRDAVFLTINGQRHDLWRAVDQDDNMLDILVQKRRNKPAAKTFSCQSHAAACNKAHRSHDFLYQSAMVPVRASRSPSHFST